MTRSVKGTVFSVRAEIVRLLQPKRWKKRDASEEALLTELAEAVFLWRRLESERSLLRSEGAERRYRVSRFNERLLALRRAILEPGDEEWLTGNIHDLWGPRAETLLKRSLASIGPTTLRLRGSIMMVLERTRWPPKKGRPGKHGRRDFCAYVVGVLRRFGVPRALERRIVALMLEEVSSPPPSDLDTLMQQVRRRLADFPDVWQWYVKDLRSSRKK